MPTRRTRRPSTVSTASTISQTLQHVSDDQYTLTIPDARHGSLQIRLKLKSGADTTVKIGGAPINCYAFACERRRNIPGGTSGPVSMPWMVKPDTIHEGLLKDGAIPLGLDPYNSNKRPDITVAPDQEYYLIAAMFHTEEFHFARLFNDGWWAKPSKVGLAEQMTSTITIPGGKTAFKGALCRAIAGGKSFHPVGYYLVPARTYTSRRPPYR